jgi:hypothetical protein
MSTSEKSETSVSQVGRGEIEAAFSVEKGDETY